nr:EOG090X0O5J [Lepidurus arcticus]
MFRAITTSLLRKDFKFFFECTKNVSQMRSISSVQILQQKNTDEVEDSSPSSGRTYNTDDTKLEKTVNQITLLGRVGSTPTKRGSSEHPVVVFSLATQSNYQYSSGDVSQKAEWHRICVFKPYLRETAFKYVTKGQRVLVMGRLIYGDVKDNEGNSRQVASIVADDIVSFRPSD